VDIRGSGTPQHRNTATPQHRSTTKNRWSTPQHRTKIQQNTITAFFLWITQKETFLLDLKWQIHKMFPLHRTLHVK